MHLSYWLLANSYWLFKQFCTKRRALFFKNSPKRQDIIRADHIRILKTHGILGFQIRDHAQRTHTVRMFHDHGQNGVRTRLAGEVECSHASVLAKQTNGLGFIRRFTHGAICKQFRVRVHIKGTITRWVRMVNAKITCGL